jgi:hypothetical protein
VYAKHKCVSPTRVPLPKSLLSARRPEGPPTAAVNPFTNPQRFFGTSSFWGYTKKNEVSCAIVICMPHKVVVKVVELKGSLQWVCVIYVE